MPRYLIVAEEESKLRGKKIVGHIETDGIPYLTEKNEVPYLRTIVVLKGKSQTFGEGRTTNVYASRSDSEKSEKKRGPSEF